MGKVVRVVAGIAIAAAGIALAAPTGGLSIAAALHVSAFVGAVLAAVVTTAATIALQALTPKPGTDPMQHVYGPRTATAKGWKWGTPIPPAARMPAKDSASLDNPVFFPRQRFAMINMRGNCMDEVTTDKWVIVDREAEIRRSDLFVFKTDDLDHYWRGRSMIHRLRTNSLVKRFLGVAPGEGLFVYECTTPPMRASHGLGRLLWAYRIRATAPNRWQAWKLLRAARANPDAFNRRLGGKPMEG